MLKTATGPQMCRFFVRDLKFFFRVPDACSRFVFLTVVLGRAAVSEEVGSAVVVPHFRVLFFSDLLVAGF